MDGAATASTTLFKTQAWIATYKSSGTSTILARNVDGMQINVVAPTTSPPQLPLVEYQLYFNRGGHSQTRYGAICQHNAVTPQ